MKSLLWTIGIGFTVGACVLIGSAFASPFIETIKGVGVVLGLFKTMLYIVAVLASAGVGFGIIWVFCRITGIEPDGGGPPDFDDPNVG